MIIFDTLVIKQGLAVLATALGQPNRKSIRHEQHRQSLKARSNLHAGKIISRKTSEALKTMGLNFSKIDDNIANKSLDRESLDQTSSRFGNSLAGTSSISRLRASGKHLSRVATQNAATIE
ncbi:hypothetical protein HGO34_00195 [Agrobacterium vitis]|uniref:Uncharacterized protein n=1 Tax=Agrobacterium vitis TaxID=373 RepID=A0AAE4W9L3_AGRVI|nr:hypothetical protein [Agrobacterium vitis]MCF1498748.1 hypothetical protein [Allorhizobium sp. Av2]MCM2438133.1 hypothetical protein [Agrobacterium vitis]MUZ56486.1 hypothetical protein [Agrobacterium vitis]MVA64377.1 hypothetical protein [Agrobacterium vitis]MVA85349.1 hypothetical protein [Agrobacterium vitis]